MLSVGYPQLSTDSVGMLGGLLGGSGLWTRGGWIWMKLRVWNRWGETEVTWGGVPTRGGGKGSLGGISMRGGGETVRASVNSRISTLSGVLGGR